MCADVNAQARGELAAAIEDVVPTASQREGVTCSVSAAVSAVPGLTHPAVQARIEASCQSIGVPYRRMVSGASHDAQSVLRRVPTGMIFVPSRDGRSHSAAEHTDPGQLALGTDVLIGTLLRLATEGPG